MPIGYPDATHGAKRRGDETGVMTMSIDAAMMAFDDVRTTCLSTYTASQSQRIADVIARRVAHDAARAALQPAAEAALAAFSALPPADQSEWLQVAYNRGLLAKVNRVLASV